MSSPAIFAVPFNVDILKAVGKHLLENWSSLEDIALVFPTQRNKLYFQQYLQEVTGKDVLLLPRLFEISEFIKEATLSPYVGILINNWQRNFFLKEAIFQAKEGLSDLFGQQIDTWAEDFFSFVSVGNRLLRFYDELLREQVSFSSLKKEALYTDYERHIEILEKIWYKYTDILRKNGLIDPVLKETALLLDEEFLRQFKAVYLVGPITMTRTETAFFKAVSSYVPLIVFFQAEKLIPHQEIILKRWNKEKEDVHWLYDSQPPRDANPPTIIKAFPSATAQIGLVLKGIEEALNAGIKPHKIGIILPDASFKYVLLGYIPEDNLNLTMGLDIKHTLTYSLLHNLYELFSTETDYGFYHRPFMKLLGHPVLKKMLKQTCQEWQEKILSHNLIYIQPTPKDPLFVFLEEIKTMLQSESIGAFCQQLSLLLQQWQGHPELKPIFTHHHEAIGLSKIWENLAEIATLDQLAVSLGKDNFLDYLHFVLAHLATQTYPLPGRLTGAIQVMEILETRNLQFDILIMPDMNEGLFPAYSEKDMFLNTTIRQRLGLPTYKEREGLFCYYFERLLKGAKQAYFAYVDSPERGVRSRFLEAMIFKQVIQDSTLEERIKDYRPYLLHHLSRSLKIRLPAVNPELVSSKLKTLKFSPSSLLCYQICPYKFYLRYLLNIQPPPKISEYITPQDRGLIFHQALKELYKDRIWEKEEQFLTALKDRLLFYFEQLPQFHQQPAARLEIEILLDKLPLFVQQELDFFKEGWRPDIRLIEREIEVEFEGIVLKGIPDRVDRKGEVFRILDYKTGRIPTIKECEISEDFRGIQLPFYLLLLKKKYGLLYERCEMLGFYDLKNQFKIKDTYKAFAADPIHYMELFETWLKETLKEIFAPDNPWERRPGKECEHCDYQDICAWEKELEAERINECTL